MAAVLQCILISKLKRGVWFDNKSTFYSNKKVYWAFTTHARMIHALYIINKAGQVIYQKYFLPKSPVLSSDDYLVLGGLFHGMHTISKSLSPTKSGGGICFLESDYMNLRCLQTPTGIWTFHSICFPFLRFSSGTKFFLIADANQPDLEEVGPNGFNPIELVSNNISGVATNLWIVYRFLP